MKVIEASLDELLEALSGITDKNQLHEKLLELSKSSEDNEEGVALMGRICDAYDDVFRNIRKLDTDDVDGKTYYYAIRAAIGTSMAKAMASMICAKATIIAKRSDKTAKEIASAIMDEFIEKFSENLKEDVSIGLRD